MKIFIADDSPRLCEQMVSLLAKMKGIEVVGQAHDTVEAFDAIRVLNPDVLILDIRMNGGGGINLLEKVKQEMTPTVVIMLTNSVIAPYRKRCLEAGADFFLDKSTELRQALEIIQSLLEQFNPAAT